MMENSFSPKISVVIPMYNTEKYIGECIGSVFAQTFQDFEIIVVDDCSTDNSCAIVENYIKNFGEKIRLIRSKKNFGGAAVPRNIAMKFARGEYIFFLDSDDMITKTAFEEIYSIAKNFDADVLDYEKVYRMNGKEISITSAILQPENFVTEPTLENLNFIERLNRFAMKRFHWGAGGQFIRRDFVIENELRFLDIISAEDLVFSLCMVCCAKKYVRVPNIFYVYRKHESSVTNRKTFTWETPLRNDWGLLVKGAEYLNKLLSKQEFFQLHPEGKILAVDVLLNLTLPWYISLFEQIPIQYLDEVIRDELKFSEDTTALTSFLFLRMNKLHLSLIKTQQEFQQFRQQIQK